MVMFVCCSSDMENVILMVLEISLWFHRFISEINFCICIKWTSSEIKFIWFEFMSVYIADIKLMGYEQDCFVSDITIQTIDNRNGLWCIGLMMTEKNCLYLISMFRHVHYYIVVAFNGYYLHALEKQYPQLTSLTPESQAIHIVNFKIAIDGLEWFR